MIQVRIIFPSEDGSPPTTQDSNIDLTPALPQGVTVCNLFAGFLAGAPGQFRERLPFLNKHEIELEWTAAPAGAAFAAFYNAGDTLAMAVLLSGADQTADEQMLMSLRSSILDPMFGAGSTSLADLPQRPLLVMVQFREQPELTPTIQLLAAALASVYFRAIRQIQPLPSSQPLSGII
ncbi:MAG: hypothetical protein JJE04_02040 [Acidobacteriia bacterium]|nr:hypothetical protein [Terriglobia bacterium]